MSRLERGNFSGTLVKKKKVIFVTKCIGRCKLFFVNFFNSNSKSFISKEII